MPHDDASISNGKRWAVLLPAMCLPLISSYFYFIVMSESPVAKAIYGATKLFTLVWPLVVVLAIFRLGWPAWKLKEKRRWKSLPLGIAVGLAIVGFAWLLFLTPLGSEVKASASDIKEKTEQMGILAHYWLFATFISVLHSLLEEYYWRWFVYGQAAKLMRPVTAHLVAGAAFASHHVVILSQFFGWGLAFFFGAFVGLGGIFWSLMLAKQKTLLGVWISHGIVDWGMMAIGYWLIQSCP